MSRHKFCRAIVSPVSSSPPLPKGHQLVNNVVASKAALAGVRLRRKFLTAIYKLFDTVTANKGDHHDY